MFHILWCSHHFTAFCTVQGFIIQFTEMAEFGWMTVIALNLYLVVGLYKNTRNVEIVYHICVWSLATVCALVPLFQQAYGFAGIWCWLTRYTGQIYRWAVFFGPLFIMWCSVIIFYGLVMRTIRLKLEHDPKLTRESKKRTKRVNALLKTYPIIFVVLYTFPLINRIVNALDIGEVYFLWIMQVLTAPLLGFANAVSFSLDERMQDLWGNYCNSLPCFMSDKKITFVEQDQPYKTKFQDGEDSLNFEESGEVKY